MCNKFALNQVSSKHIGYMVLGADESGDYTDTFTDGGGSYDVKPKRFSAFWGLIKYYRATIEFTFPYQSSWESIMLIIDIQTPRISDTFMWLEMTVGNTVPIDLYTNGMNYFNIDSIYEVSKLVIWYNTDPVNAGGDWIKIDYLAVLTQP